MAILVSSMVNHVPNSRIHKNSMDFLMTIEEDNWISKIFATFDKIGRQIAPDENLLNMFRDSGKSIKYGYKAAVKLQKLCAKRFDEVLDEILDQKLTDTERNHLTRTNYHLANLMIATQVDFSTGNSIKHQLEFLSCKELPEYENLSETPKILASDVFPCGNIGDDHFAEKYQGKGHQLSIFFKRTDLTCLFLIFTLLRDSHNPGAQRIQCHIHRLIIKKMRQCPELRCWQMPEYGIQFFYKCLSEIGFIMQNVVLASLMNKA